MKVHISYAGWYLENHTIKKEQMGKLMKRNMNWGIIKVNIIYTDGRVFVKLFYNVIMSLDPQI